MSIGESLRSARKKAGWTQQKLADELGVSAITIRQYESNKRQPRIETLQQIAQKLGLRPFDLLPADLQAEFESLPEFFESEDPEIVETAKDTEKVLLENEIRHARYGKLWRTTCKLDDLIVKEIKRDTNEFTEDFLRETLMRSFESLSFRGKYEAVERVAELEQLRRFAGSPANLDEAEEE